MENKCIKDLKRGELFKLRPNGRVYVRDEYNRSTRKYEYYDYDNANAWHEANGTKRVITDFEF